MSYEPIIVHCYHKRHGEMEYIGCGDYRCPKCGDVFHDDEYDEEDDDEYISVIDAANIWLSNGKDEDYMFGYSEEELEEALE